MLNNPNEESHEWYQQAAHCAQQADAQTDPKVKQQFLELKRLWLLLARSYEFTESQTETAKPSRESPMSCRVVHVHGMPHAITISQRSKIAWVAVGECTGTRIEVVGPSLMAHRGAIHFTRTPPCKRSALQWIAVR
jgi:hypothetical protein